MAFNNIALINEKKPKYSVASLFCGAGGLDIGFEMGGFKTIWMNDFNKDATMTASIWCRDAKVVCGDVTRLSALLVPKADVMLGGFPCQTFSSMGARKGLNDPRGVLYKEYIRILKLVQPYMFIGENVEGLLTWNGGEAIRQIIQDFAEVGYNMSYDLVDAADYGVAQNRRRVIIQGWRKDLPPHIVPKPLKQSPVSQRDVLWGKREPEHDEIDWGSFSPRYMMANRKRDWDSPSYTILAGARGCPLHPSSPDEIRLDNKMWKFASSELGVTRRFAYWEAGIIQSFPEDMKFCGNLENKYKQIGNAVPPLLGKAYAEVILQEFERLNLKPVNTL